VRFGINKHEKFFRLTKKWFLKVAFLELLNQSEQLLSKVYYFEIIYFGQNEMNLKKEVYYKDWKIERDC